METTNAVSASVRAHAKRKRRLVLAHASFALNGGQSQTLTLNLGSVAQSLLKKLKRLPVVASVSAHDSFGDPATQRIGVTLKALASKKKPHKHP